MAGVNKVILLGNLGKDPEIRTFEGGRKSARFSIATSESYKDKDGNKVEQTEWHSVQFWGPIVDVIEKYLKKGNQVYVEGKLQTRSYDDKDGIKRYVTEIVGQNMNLLGGRTNDGGATEPNHYSAPSQASESIVNDPIPAALSSSDVDDLPF